MLVMAQAFSLLDGLFVAMELQDKSLQQEIDGVVFNNPIGLSAGFDKNNCHMWKMLVGLLADL